MTCCPENCPDCARRYQQMRVYVEAVKAGVDSVAECPHGESDSRNCPECYGIEVEEHERRWMEEGV